MRGTLLTLSMVLAAVGLSACSGSGTEAPAGQGDVGAGIGAPVRSANCTDWKRAGPRQRRESLADIREFAGSPVGQARGHGNTLDDDKAYRLLDNYCRKDYARGFKLYKLYTRAAAFSPQR